MPLLKYYCDYCEKQFQDTPAARKRHLQGVQHQRAKALYYQNSSSSFLPDANHQMHPESFGKGVCNRFLRTGSCQYGDSCKYYHPKQDFQSINPQVIPDNIHSPSIAESQLVRGGPFPGTHYYFYNYGLVSPVTRYGDSYGFGSFPFGIMFLHILPILFVCYQVVRLGIVWEFRWVTYLHHLSHRQRVDILLFHLLIGDIDSYEIWVAVEKGAHMFFVPTSK
ncbi:hypothetical protein RHMOL_Rhmol05G0170500 [Rhododendron molle]|uniref:Uncharacterized protein n=1 Tax=Rhododendron molle TaxID=49168 RepID=A0ACC0NQ55_RHOML|nr:hypothetical protein RHMOL_Rhmol05G0170500 [Rhododendron molle]